MVATGLAVVHTNHRRLHDNILFLTPRRSLASLARAYGTKVVTGFTHYVWAHYYIV